MKRVLIPFFISHLGCPNRCVFCDQERIAGAVSALPEPEEILSRIHAFSLTSPGRDLEVAFYGGTFTALPHDHQARLLEPIAPLLASGAVRAIRISTRPDAVSPATASFLRQSGVTMVELGVQSMDDEVLALSGRGHNAADVERAFETLAGEGIAAGAQLMPGLPGDDETRSLGSLAKVLELGAASLRIYPALVLSGTELALRYRKGEYRPLSLDAAVGVAKKMLLYAWRANVPVIRMGLQPTAELTAPGVVVAGPFHPAFGQLVQSELYFDLLARIAATVPEGSRLDLSCHPGRISDLVGQKRRNLERIRKDFGITVGGVRPDASLSPTVVARSGEGGSASFDLLDL